MDLKTTKTIRALSPQKSLAERALWTLMYGRRTEKRLIQLAIILLLVLAAFALALLPAPYSALVFALVVATLFLAFLSVLTRALGGLLLRLMDDPAKLQRLTGAELEILCGEIYRRKGFKVRRRNTDGPAPDGGVDLDLFKDGVLVVVQCKQRPNEDVSVEKIRELMGAMSRDQAQAGVFVTTGRFTEPAITEARAGRVTMVDHAGLWELIESVKANDLLQRTIASRTEYKPGDLCPDCGGQLVGQNGKYGPFVGCSNYRNEARCTFKYDPRNGKVTRASKQPDRQ